MIIFSGSQATKVLKKTRRQISLTKKQQKYFFIGQTEGQHKTLSLAEHDRTKVEKEVNIHCFYVLWWFLCAMNSCQKNRQTNRNNSWAFWEIFVEQITEKVIMLHWIMWSLQHPRGCHGNFEQDSDLKETKSILMNKLVFWILRIKFQNFLIIVLCRSKKC